MLSMLSVVKVFNSILTLSDLLSILVDIIFIILYIFSTSLYEFWNLLSTSVGILVLDKHITNATCYILLKLSAHEWSGDRL